MFSNWFRPITPPRKSTALVLCLDYDGCLDSAEARKVFIQWLIKRLKAEPQQDQDIIICIGSARQSLLLDRLNSAKHFTKLGRASSSVELGTDFKKSLEKELEEEFGDRAPKVYFNPLVTSDIHFDLPTGTTVQLMKKAYNAKMNGEYVTKNHTKFTATDRSNKKVTLFKTVKDRYDVPKAHSRLRDSLKTIMPYMFAHNMAWADKNVKVLFVDDRSDILDHQYDFYADNPLLLPQSCTFQTLRWDWNSSIPTYLFPAPSSTIQGLGKTNPNYVQDIRSFALTLPTRITPNEIQRLMPAYMAQKTAHLPSPYPRPKSSVRKQSTPTLSVVASQAQRWFFQRIIPNCETISPTLGNALYVGERIRKILMPKEYSTSTTITTQNLADLSIFTENQNYGAIPQEEQKHLKNGS